MLIYCASALFLENKFLIYMIKKLFYNELVITNQVECENMNDLIILGILVVIIAIGMIYSINHFKGKSGCCGGGNTYISKKKLKKVIAKKTFTVEGMTCENCAARVLRYVHDIDGVVGKVNLRKRELLISMDRDVSDEEIKATVTKAGYQVI